MNPAFPENDLKDQDFNQTQIHLASTQEITWRVQNVHSMPTKVDYALDSPPFVFQNATWCLRFYPNVTSNPKCCFSVGLKIVRLSSLVPHHKVLYRLMLKEDKKHACYHAADFDEDHKETRDMEIFPLHKVLDFVLFSRNSFDVACRVSCYKSLRAVDAFSQTELSMQDAKDVGALGPSLKNLLLNGQDHDVVLKVKDKELRAHQNILRARSSVFESMLSHDMIENNSGPIDIPDCDSSAFEQFLIYLYSGEVDTLDAGNMLPLYYVADKYDMGHLKEKCREFIKLSLSSSNITDVVQTALDHGDADLLRWSTDYFVKEVDEILPTAEWLSFLKATNSFFIKATKNMIGWRKIKRIKESMNCIEESLKHIEALYF